ncbi:MAG: OmpA family protein [Micropepsaceae bacterium]
MRFLGALLIAALLPLGGCAGTGATGTGSTGAGATGDVSRDIEDLPQSYIVFFAFNSAVLDETAQSVIAQAADDALRYQPTMIEIAGFSGEGPNARTSSQIADLRYAAVAEALTARGLDASLFARGELMDEANIPDAAVRRIEIRLELP